MDSYAELHEDNPAGTAITVVVAGTFYKWITSAVTVQGLADLIVASAVSDDFTIQSNGGGLYVVSAAICFDGPNGAQVEWGVHKNGVLQVTAGTHCTMRGATLRECVTINALLPGLVNGDVLDLRVTSDGAGDVISVFHITLYLMSFVRDK